MWRSFLFAFKLTNVCVTDIMYVMPWCAGEQRAREFAMKLASMLIRRICWACTSVRVSLRVCMRMIPCNKMCVVSICLLRKTSVQTVYTRIHICAVYSHMTCLDMTGNTKSNIHYDFNTLWTIIQVIMCVLFTFCCSLFIDNIYYYTIVECDGCDNSSSLGSFRCLMWISARAKWTYTNETKRNKLTWQSVCLFHARRFLKKKMTTPTTMDKTR